MGKYDLDNEAYDQHLAKNKNEKELRSRAKERRNANKGVVGWHFGCGGAPFKTKNVGEFRHELDKQGLMMRDDVKRELK